MYQREIRDYRFLWILLLPLLILFPKLFILFSLVSAIVYINIKRRKKERKNKAIKFYGYKIFKFLINQISSGILIGDAIQGIHRIVLDSHLKKTLIHMAALYHQTNDIQLALKALEQEYKGEEVNALCSVLYQGLQSGTHSDTLEKMENLLFKKYLFFIKYETKLRKRRSILSVLLYCVIIVLMVSIPMILDMLDALDKIFI